MPVTIRGRTAKGSQTFLLFLIKPSHYDDDGYVIQWARNDIPSNTLATLYGIAQYPRAVDIARPLRAAGIPVCIGGFHTAGSLAMLPEPPPEIRGAWDLGISIFAGEAEGVWARCCATRSAAPCGRSTSTLPTCPTWKAPRRRFCHTP